MKKIIFMFIALVVLSGQLLVRAKPQMSVRAGSRLDIGFIWNDVSNKWRCVAFA